MESVYVLCLHGYFLYRPHKQGPKENVSSKNSDAHGNHGMGASAGQY